MRSAIAGGHGQIALRLAKILSQRGDEVVALIRNPDHAGDVRQAGADPVVVDLEHASEDDVAQAIAGADVVVVCPSNPVVSIGPILAVPGLRDAIVARRAAVTGVSGIVGGAPVAGMADRLMPAVGIEVTALGVADSYKDFLGAWLVDDADAPAVPDVEALGIRCATADTIMVDDGRAEAVARAALELVS